MWDLLNVGTFLMTKTPEEIRFPYSTSTNDMTQDEGARSRKETGMPTPSLSRKSKKRPSGSAQSNSMSGGNKLKHLKKGDGEPLLRKDLQYDFLNAVFEDDKAVFTNSYEPSQTAKQTFANLYIDTIARSSSTSKVVKDQLLTEHEPAKKIAMVCLLVNLGRLDTTLTCACLIPS
jgi:Ino eighty subunit 1